MRLYVIPQHQDILSPGLRKVVSLNKQASRFEQIVRSFPIESEQYIIACQQLARTERGISFCKTRRVFTVRPTIDGKRIFIGNEKNFDDAKHLLHSFLQYKSKTNS